MEQEEIVKLVSEGINEIKEEILDVVTSNAMSSTFIELGKSFIHREIGSDGKPTYSYDAEKHLKTFAIMSELWDNQVVSPSENSESELDNEAEKINE